jgi:hypothetical protein
VAAPSSQLVRIPLAYPIGTRSQNNLDKDPFIANGMLEQYGDHYMVDKRPGMVTNVEQPAPPGGQGQGLTFYNGFYFEVVNDILYRTSGSDIVGSDGTIWDLAPTPAWYGRAFFTATVFNGRMWVIGGEATTQFADINYSVDGVTWQQNASGAPFNHRQGHQVVVLNGLMYLLGGLMVSTSGTSLMNDVWYTSDGANWTQATAAAPWTARDNFTAVVGNNGIYIYGGDAGGGTLLDDVWFSVDGINWTQLTSAATGTPRRLQSMFFFNQKVIIVGGDNGSGAQNDVFTSPDGQTWTSSSPVFATGRYEMASTIYHNMAWLISGTTTGGANDANVYSSTDGVTWTLVTAAPGFGNRGGAAAVTFNTPSTVNQYNYQTMWVMGGADSGVDLQQVYRARLNVNSPTSYVLSPTTNLQRYQFTTYLNGTHLMIKNQTNLWDLAGGVLTKVTDTNYPSVTVPGIVSLGGFLHVMTPSGEIHSNQIDDPTTWPSLNFITADYEDDPGIALAKHLNYVVALGQSTTQFFYDNGANQPLGSPLAPYQSANMKIGCANGFTVINMQGMLYFVSTSTSNARRVTRFNGLQPEVVSTYYIERIIGTHVVTADYALELGTADGRSLYILSNNLDQYFVYDANFGEWYIWDIFPGTQIAFATNFQPGSYTCQTLNGKLITVSTTTYTDDGIPFELMIQTPNDDHGNMFRKFWGRVTLVCDQTNPLTPTNCSVQVSDDDYQNFVTIGTFDTSTFRPNITRLGSSRRRAWAFVQQDDQPSVRPMALELSWSQGESF